MESDAAPRDRAVIAVRAALQRISGSFEVRDLTTACACISGVIEGLVGEVDQPVVERLRSAWWGLELFNATALDEGRSLLSARDRQDVAEARDRLRATLREV
jgi:hypothetical protein